MYVSFSKDVWVMGLERCYRMSRILDYWFCRNLPSSSGQVPVFALTNNIISRTSSVNMPSAIGFH